MERDLQEIKEAIKSRTDFVELVSQYTRLKRSGKNWTGLCPFHADKKPSFSVSPLGFYKCFSCGEGGDMFTFAQKKENLDFIEALEFLARRAGIPFERKQLGGDKERASEREQMLELNRLAVQYFQDLLQKSADAKAYLVQRALLKETQERFELGYAPPDWEGLLSFLERKRANLALAAKAGLLKPRQQEGTGYYDAFRHRLMFPIHDLNGRVIAFGGRAMGDDPAKYLNTEQTPLFDKSRTLYGLYFARKRLSGETPPVFVEGYVDVITAHQAGFAQCVATLGTSLTEEHARMLIRYNPRVIICYDGDAAGIRATLRGAEVWEQTGVEGAEVRVARLPAGEDPDSLLRRGETAAFQEALDHAVPRVDFQLELALKRHDLQTEAGRDAAFREAVPILATIGSLAQRSRYADRLAHLHPLHGRYEPGRVVQQLLADVDAYAKQSRGARDKGYPLTEQANRGPMAEQPPPPVYRPPSRDRWGETWPMTRQVVRKENGNDRDRALYARRGQRNSVGGDPAPPPIETPTLTGAEKAERQLLRALFSPQWRTYILGRLQPEDFPTPLGRQLFTWIAETPADPDGGVDPLLLLRRADVEESAITPETPFATSSSERETLHIGGTDEEDWFSAGSNEFDARSGGNEATNRKSEQKKLKMSYFLRDIWEESAYLVSNEQVSEAGVNDCIRRLQKERQERDRRQLAEVLRQAQTLPPDQRRAFIAQYQQKVRELRGSSPEETA